MLEWDRRMVRQFVRKTDELGAVLDQVDDKQNNPQQLIL
jgi:hypothetical protein